MHSLLNIYAKSLSSNINQLTVKCYGYFVIKCYTIHDVNIVWILHELKEIIGIYLLK